MDWDGGCQRVLYGWRGLHPSLSGLSRGTALKRCDSCQRCVQLQVLVNQRCFTTLGSGSGLLPGPTLLALLGLGPLPRRRLLLSEQVALGGRQIPRPQVVAFRSQRGAKQAACDLSSGARAGSVYRPP